MQFIHIETEITTAVTDLLLAIVSIIGIYAIQRRKSKPAEGTKLRVWILSFVSLSVASLLGFFAHGFQMAEPLRDFLWQPLYLTLGWTISLFAAGVILDLRRGKALKFLTPISLVVGLAFYLITLLVPGSFLIFIAYEALAMLFALIAYLYIATARQNSFAWWMAAGIALSIIAAVFQAIDSAGFKLIWEFDHNGIFHLIQMLGIGALIRGIREGADA